PADRCTHSRRGVRRPQRRHRCSQHRKPRCPACRPPPRRAARAGTLSAMNFADRLAAAVTEKGTSVCIGLDPRIDLLPPELVTGLTPRRARPARAYQRFCERGSEAVAADAAPVQPQRRLRPGLGGDGSTAVETVCDAATEHGLIVIADAKRGDIGSTAQAYAEAWLGPRDGGRPVADAVTVNPYMGGDSLEPFLRACGEGAGLFVLT